ncbi:MAG: N-acetyltransferase [Oscillospiraceae bacterium]|jgi:predicted N-acetyltransferase YhbS|nr:N-acetyltransferase [Oscillospiraceae bacterium]
MTIRQERKEDYAAVLRLTYAAFQTAPLVPPERMRCDEHYLIHLMQTCEFLIPELCFVAERAGEIVGHILYTQSEILRPDGAKTSTITFGPLSVLPKVHKQGIGRALVEYSLEKARELGYGAVLITGVPDYYPKIGFSRARDFALTLENGASPDYFMAFELVPGTLRGGGVLHFLPPEFELSERDDGAFEQFHERFIAEYRL